MNIMTAIELKAQDKIRVMKLVRDTPGMATEDLLIWLLENVVPNSDDEDQRLVDGMDTLITLKDLPKRLEVAKKAASLLETGRVTL